MIRTITLTLLCGLAVIGRSTLLAQPCNLVLSGHLLDEGTGIPMAFATVYVEELKSGTAADTAGFFKLDKLCAGAYHLRVNHIGCETKTLFVDLRENKEINVLLHHHNELVDEVVIHEEHSEEETKNSVSINRERITEMANKDLSDVLDQVAGVSSLRSGAGISKPVIHGMYGNRISILNNGIVQSGQQWGNDHAPEIDPFTADHIAVVKGASALAYPGSNLGGIVLIEPEEIGQDPHLHGAVNYIFQTNGLGHSVNARLERAQKWASWRISATGKLSGDHAAPTYLLTNTGKREYDIAAQLDRKFGRWKTQFYYSFFYTEIGILRGSHIGNITDLEEAIGRDVPFFTSDKFTYTINAPRQQVQHHLLKLQTHAVLNEHQSVTFRYGGQYNGRKEFDVRRGDRSNLPALSLLQWNQFIEGQYQHFFENHLHLHTGAQFKMTDNTNNPETGILPLIPDYRNYQGGAFLIAQKEQGPVTLELGARYDLKHLQAVTISSSVPRTIERFYHTFHNYSLSGGARIVARRNLKIQVDLGHVLRSPEVNELYSSGLHQGVSGIELGNRSLKSERSTKGLLSLDWNVRNRLFVQVVGYYQYIKDYIYLQPQDSLRLTIRGAYPVFTYEQTDAELFGTDVLLSYDPITSLRLMVKYAFLQGDDVSNRKPLVYMPSNNLSGSITYSVKDGTRMKNNSVSVNGKYVFKQTHLNDDQDILPPPNGYFLLGATVGTTIQLNQLKLRLSLNGENLLNTRYRDYLNRQRYFADDLGWNLNFRVGLTF